MDELEVLTQRVATLETQLLATTQAVSGVCDVIKQLLDKLPQLLIT